MVCPCQQVVLELEVNLYMPSADILFWMVTNQLK